VKIPILDLKPATEELRSDLNEAFGRVLASGHFLLGPELEAFEREYAESVGAKYCVGVANGLEALQLVLMAWGVGPGDEVIVPSHGYIATWLAVTHVGATLVPCEPDPLTWNLDPARLSALITPRTKVILPIHLYGQTADMDGINAVARPHGIKVLEDGAQSHGARHRGRQSGNLGDAAGISFYPSKNLGALADGGAVLTNDELLAERIRHLRNYGAKVRYHNEHLGLNSRLSELQAAFLRVKLAHLAAWNARRVALAERYRSGLAGIKEVVLPTVPAWAEPVWHLFVIRSARREALREYLLARGIGTQVHYPIPPHLSGAYRNLGWKAGAFPLAETLARDVLSLPIGPHTAPAEVDEVCRAIRDFHGRG
jgi:dTDP-4-amino-4,6-dideoxygalactose transaminase